MARRAAGGEQLDLLATTDRRRQVLTDLMTRIMSDEDWRDASESQIAAEMVRACVGIGKWAMRMPTSELKPPGRRRA